jgi:hypothetical protein
MKPIGYAILFIAIGCASALFGYANRSVEDFKKASVSNTHSVSVTAKAVQSNSAAIVQLQNRPEPAPVVIVKRPVIIGRTVVVPRPAKPVKPTGFLRTLKDFFS